MLLINKQTNSLTNADENNTCCLFPFFESTVNAMLSMAAAVASSSQAAASICCCCCCCWDSALLDWPDRMFSTATFTPNSSTNSRHFNRRYPGAPGFADTRMSPFWILLELRLTEMVSSDNWSYKTHKAPVKSSPPTNQHPTFYRPDAVHQRSPPLVSSGHFFQVDPGASIIGAKDDGSGEWWQLQL